MKPRRKPEPDNAPNAFRLQHGDVEQTPIRYGDQRDADPNRPTVARSRRASDNPLAEFLARKLISPEAYFVGQSIGRWHELTTRGIGAVNLNGAGGGFSDGLGFSRLRAMDELNALLAHIAEPWDRQVKIGSFLVAVCGDRRTIRSIVGPKSWARQQASDMLCTYLERIAAATAKEAA